MEYISGEEYTSALASNAYAKTDYLEKQVKELISIVNNLQIDILIIKNKLNDVLKELK